MLRSLFTLFFSMAFILRAAALVGSTLPEMPALSHAWETLPPATCMPDHCFCEPVRSGLVRQPVNTWSNLAFVLAGMVILGMAAQDAFFKEKDEENPMKALQAYPVVLGFSTIMVGFGSMFYHGSMTFAGQVTDILSMYLVASFLMLYNFTRARRMHGLRFFVIFLAINLVLGFLSTRWPEFRRPIFLILVAGILLSELLVRRTQRDRLNIKYLVVALFALALGCGAWLFDVSEAFCLPDSLLQAHAAWHFEMAAAILFIFLYLRSSKLKITDLLIA